MIYQQRWKSGRESFEDIRFYIGVSRYGLQSDMTNGQHSNNDKMHKAQKLLINVYLVVCNQLAS